MARSTVSTAIPPATTATTRTHIVGNRADAPSHTLARDGHPEIYEAFPALDSDNIFGKMRTKYAFPTLYAGVVPPEFPP